MKTFRGRAVDGEIYLEDPEAFARHVKAMPELVELMVRSARPLRSYNQNGYYRFVLKQFAAGIGETPDKVHRDLGERFLQDDEGKVRSTTTLDTREFAEFLEDCLQLAAEHGVYIEDPRQAGCTEGT